MVERLNHSKGPAKVQMAVGIQKFESAGSDLTTLLKQTYPEFFEPYYMGAYSSANGQAPDIFSI